MADAAIAILADPARWQAMSAAAAADARARFAESRIIGQYEAIYADAVDRVRDRRAMAPVAGAAPVTG
jgi:glycosyltransferase involved in cell wall biosynthesis